MSSWPSRAHNSSATCGASGATISVNGTATSRGSAPPPCTSVVRWLLSSNSRAIAVLKLSSAMSARTASIVRCRSRRVSSSAGASDDARLAGLLVDEVAPQPLQEPVHADDVGGAPRPLLVERAHEHLVEAQRVGAVVAVDVVGRDRVAQALAHLAELARDRLALEEVLAVAFLDLGRRRRTRPARRRTPPRGCSPG